ncbi:subclass B3 metallo-beta-lactamase [Qipengyuania sp. 1NDW9]|uniref:subclass B3 metallo-beta-lactamase n=1 Tax=Qipengyuania xiapuensis TaxID=2867236 RepID=UPI001C8696CC|nr:subclass B3 metallo-beta-lactamase [Qipengyuania xiapuensis]MBX7493273.1 subclass B3 metallo-beta-lactamase [Qipengyuania xiapuensis]
MFARLALPLAMVLGACANAHTGHTDPVPSAHAEPQVPEERFVDACEKWDEWDKPARPFRLMGNSWYVGTCGISAILVAGDEGHILLDSGVEAAAPHVLASIRSLGFEPSDIRYILMSHEHFDHVAGHAAIAEATGAEIVASERAAPVLVSGKVASDDPQANSGHPDMEPVEVSRIAADGDVVELGNLRITAHTTPGHTPGALSWTWWSCTPPDQPPVCSRMVYVDSLSAVSGDDYRFTDHPETVGAFRTSIDKVRFLPCDILTTPHPSSSNMIERWREGTYGKPGECQRYADALGKRLDERLAKEAAQ